MAKISTNNYEKSPQATPLWPKLKLFPNRMRREYLTKPWSTAAFCLLRFELALSPRYCMFRSYNHGQKMWGTGEIPVDFSYNPKGSLTGLSHSFKHVLWLMLWSWYSDPIFQDSSWRAQAETSENHWDYCMVQDTISNVDFVFYFKQPVQIYMSAGFVNVFCSTPTEVQSGFRWIYLFITLWRHRSWATSVKY